jgi:hypothetical protein
LPPRNPGEVVLLERHRLAVQQVLDPHLPQLRDRHPTLQQVVHRRDHLRTNRDPLADREDAPEPRLQRVRDRDDHLVDPQRRHERRQRLAGPRHLQPADHRPLLQRIVVHEPTQFHALLAAAADLAHRHHPGRPLPPFRAARRRLRLRSETARPATRPAQQAAKGRQRVQPQQTGQPEGQAHHRQAECVGCAPVEERPKPDGTSKEPS